MSYDEHLISMAGGDGEPSLDAIQELFGSIAFPDTPEERDAAERKILALVREQAAQLRNRERNLNAVTSIAVKLEASKQCEDREIAEDLYAALKLS